MSSVQPESSVPVPDTNTADAQRPLGASGRLVTEGVRRHSDPYSELASIYDQVVGESAFPEICASFEEAVKRFRIGFNSAADIGCGTGTFALYLTNYEVPVIAVDRSAAMLRIAAAKNRGRSVQLLQQDLRGLSLPQPVDLITCNHDTLNYLLHDSDLKKIFERCNQNLVDEGHLIFDIIRAVSAPPHCAIQRISLPATLSVWRIYWNPRARLSIVRMKFLSRRGRSAPRKTIEMHVQRWHPLPTIESLLTASGFRLRGVCDVHELTTVTAQTSWVKCVAQKVSGSDHSPSARARD
jgi:SAM-dependent methyltransferase